MTVQEIVEKHWEDMFDEINKIEGDNMYEILIIVELEDGTTVEKSWVQRNELLRQKGL